MVATHRNPPTLSVTLTVGLQQSCRPLSTRRAQRPPSSWASSSTSRVRSSSRATLRCCRHGSAPALCGHARIGRSGIGGVEASRTPPHSAESGGGGSRRPFDLDAFANVSFAGSDDRTCDDRTKRLSLHRHRHPLENRLRCRTWLAIPFRVQVYKVRVAGAR